ncbi:MAG: Uma2 family endonuclease [Rhodospirillales bacterium]|nr:Uma2 family endonuclease [Rhodospirillales bacterium]
MGEMLPNYPRVSLEAFHAFRDERPKSEKWELIDGVPMMMPPPSLIHQRIANNIWFLLNNRLQMAKPEWRADHEIGVLLGNDSLYNPEPDVTVIDTEIEIDQVYAERFYFVAEVLSSSDRPERRAGSDKPIVLVTKIAYYQRHEPCRGVLVVRQDIVHADLHIRNGDGSWSLIEVRAPSDRIVIPDIGDIGPLADLYRHTPLFPKSG